MPHGRVSRACPATQVRLTIEAALNAYFSDRALAEEERTLPYRAKVEQGEVTLYGHTALLHAHATYDGHYGKWEVLLAHGTGKLLKNTPLEVIRRAKVDAVCGKPYRVR